MSTPEGIARQIESAIQMAISDAALVFSQQAAPNGSSCALQTRFLDNLVAKFRKQPTSESGRLPVQEQQSNDEVAWDLSAGNLARPEQDLAQAQETLTFDFAEEATWASLIAEAGFCAQEGNFF
jgi:hypothetical protein